MLSSVHRAIPQPTLPSAESNTLDSGPSFNNNITVRLKGNPISDYPSAENYPLENKSPLLTPKLLAEITGFH